MKFPVSGKFRVRRKLRVRTVIGGIALSAIGLSLSVPPTGVQSHYELQTSAGDPSSELALDPEGVGSSQRLTDRDPVDDSADGGTDSMTAPTADQLTPPQALALETPVAPESPTQQPTATTRPTVTPSTSEQSAKAPGTTGPTTNRPTTTQPTTTPPTTARPTATPPTTTRPTTAAPTTARPTTTPPTTARPTTTPPTTSGPPTTRPPTTQPPKSYQLVWADEFNSFDQTKWRPEHSTYGDGNNELQCYTPNNVTVTGGVLHLTAKDETVTCPNGSTRDYSSGMVRTRNLASWKYGRFEARINLPAGQGFWPGLWMSPVTNTYGSWPRSGELDIVEAIGSKPNRIIGSVHWQGPSGHRLSNKEKWLRDGTTFTGGFHTYAVEWEPGKITWFVDGEQYHQVTSWDAPAGAAFPAPFNQQFYLKMQLSVGGRSPGNPDSSTPFPSSMQVDWIRVYQLR